MAATAVSETLLPRSVSVETAESKRLVSLDVFRGVIILLMMFVNDIAGVPGAPWWLKHAGFRDDFMTITDLVFPAFLFMVGMAMPYALGRRLDRGEPSGPVWRHALIRTFGLVAIGFIMVNSESAGSTRPFLVPLWQLAIFSAVLVTWHAYSTWKKTQPTRVIWLRSLGALAILILACLYPGRAPFGPPGMPPPPPEAITSGLLAMKPGWWGIIGLIGWAYLGACLVYIPGRKRMEALLGGMGLWMLVVMAQSANAFSNWPLWRSSWNFVPAMAPHASLVLAGALLSTMLQPASGITTLKARVRWALVYAAGLYAASFLFHAPVRWNPIFRVSKLLGSPAWCLRSAAYSTIIWLAIYLVVDVWQKRRGTRMLADAGGNALLVYLLAPMFGVVVELAFMLAGKAGGWDALTPTLTLGLIRSCCTAIGFTWLAGYLYRRGFFLKL